MTISPGWFYFRYKGDIDQNAPGKYTWHYGTVYTIAVWDSYNDIDGMDSFFNILDEEDDYYSPIETYIFPPIVLCEIIALICLIILEFNLNRIKKDLSNKRKIIVLTYISLLLPILIIVIGIPFMWKFDSFFSYIGDNLPKSLIYFSCIGYSNLGESSSGMKSSDSWMPSFCWLIQICILLFFHYGIKLNNNKKIDKKE